jgi:hypothetical protein
MQLNQTMLFLYNGDTVTYQNERCSMRTIVRTLKAKGYSVAFRLYPNNALKTLTNNKWPFAVMIGDALLIICPPPLVAEPAEGERDSQDDSDGSTSGTSDDKSSGHSSITNYFQVDPDFLTGYGLGDSHHQPRRGLGL